VAGLRLHTDADLVVFFRRSDVVSTGDLFVTTAYPVVDAQRGGSIQGVIDGLNRNIDITIPKDKEEGGTYVIRGHGRISDLVFEVMAAGGGLQKLDG
jgi:cyclase